MTSRRRAIVLSVAACAVVGFGGCGDDDGGSGGDAVASGDKSPIKVMTITSVGSPLTNYPDVEADSKAAADAINQAGGAGGRTIEYSFCNTRGDANGALKCAREAVEKEVAAVVGRVDIFAPQSTPVLEKAGIPDVGLLPTGSPTDVESPISYPLHGGNSATYSAMAYAMKEDGRKRFITASIDLPIAFTQIEPARAAAKDAGLEDLGIIKIPAQGVTDYAPFAQQVKDKGADAVLVVLGPAGLQAFGKAIEAVGVDARLGATIFSFGQEEAAAIGETAGLYFVTSPFPSTENIDNEAIQQFNEELDAAGVKDDPTLRDAAGLNSWLAMHAMAEVAKGIEGDVTAESMTQALDKSGPIDLFGVLNWEPSKLGSEEYGAFARFPPATYTTLTFEGGKYVETDVPPIEEPLGAAR